MRSFVAIELPETLKAEAARLQERLKADGSNLRQTIKWIGPDGLHLTMKFLGEIGEDRVPAVVEVLRGVAAETPALALMVQGLGGFPSLQAARVVWIGVSGPDRSMASLRRLHALLEAALEGRGFSRESRPFAPHVTLGRARPGCQPAFGPDVRGPGGDHAVAIGGFEARELLLIKSDLRPTGAVYTRVSAVPLIGSPLTRSHRMEGVLS